MPQFDALSGIVNNFPTDRNAQGPTKDLGKNEFLRLMMTQLSYQDPMNPMDATQFSSQLAEFSTVEQLANLTQTTENALNADMMLAQSINNTLSATIIGKNAKVVTESVKLTADQDINLHCEVPKHSQEVKLEIRNANGQVVRTLTEDNVPAGMKEFEWDGRDGKGNTLPEGNYSIKMTATYSDGSSKTLPPYLIGKIEAVQYSTNGAVLVVDGQTVGFGNVVEIREPEEEGGNNLLNNLFAG
ncbi:hypothetical protein K8I28_07085 [bacterium]|nr:hypothetical protein [bacterium]